jgi:NhaA family Na+:H+ antiporter
MHAPPPPGSWPFAHKLVRKALGPVESFLAIEAASGIVLLATAVIALLWASSPWRELYAALWHTPIGIRLGPWSFERDLHFWINDGLMTVFFFVVGLEIRREMHRGELSELRRALLPVVAALGGMLVPAAIYFGFNRGLPSANGWGVPMATDIAFAVGVLAILGKRVPPALRILLLALAVIDDVGAIVVIAIFYSSSLSWVGFTVGLAGLGGVFALQKLGARSPWLYLAPGMLVWAGAYAAGIHPTIAGVILGLLTPVRVWFGTAAFAAVAERKIDSLRDRDASEHDVLSKLDDIDRARREAVSPLDRLQHALHVWVAFVIMPLFALANAGVTLGQATLDGAGRPVLVGVVLGLVVGKPIGVIGLPWLASRVGLVRLPKGVGWRHVAVVGLCAGIGFTMALFIAGLAFGDSAVMPAAKLAILGASAIAGVAAIIVGRLVMRGEVVDGAARDEHEAEQSTEG